MIRDGANASAADKPIIPGELLSHVEIVAVEQGILGDRPWRHGLLPSLTTFFSARVDVLVNCSAAPQCILRDRDAARR